MSAETDRAAEQLTAALLAPVEAVGRLLAAELDHLRAEVAEAKSDLARIDREQRATARDLSAHLNGAA